MFSVCKPPIYTIVHRPIGLYMALIENSTYMAERITNNVLVRYTAADG